MADDFLGSATNKCRNVAITGSTNPIVIYDPGALTPPRKTAFVVYHVFVQGAEANTVTFQSGASLLSGAIGLNTANNFTLEHNNNGFPIFKAVALGDKFQIANSGSKALVGWALIGDVDRI